MTKTQRVAICTPIVLCVIYGIIAWSMLSGCSNPDKRVQVAIGLTTTKDVFIATATAAKRLCEQGVLSEADCVEIETIYGEGKDILIIAKRIWDAMVVTDSFDRDYIYTEQIMAVTMLSAQIENIIRNATE